MVTGLTGGGKAWCWRCQTPAQEDSRLAIEREKRRGRGRQRKAARLLRFVSEADGKDEMRRDEKNGRGVMERRRPKVEERSKEKEKRQREREEKRRGSEEHSKGRVDRRG